MRGLLTIDGQTAGGSVMVAPKGNKFAIGNKGGGRHSQFNLKFIGRAELAGPSWFH